MVVQVGQLFLVPVAGAGVGVGAGAPLLLKQASDDSSSSELLFSPLPGQDRSQEAGAWQVQCLSHPLRHVCLSMIISAITALFCPLLFNTAACSDTNMMRTASPAWDSKNRSCPGRIFLLNKTTSFSIIIASNQSYSPCFMLAPPLVNPSTHTPQPSP